MIDLYPNRMDDGAIYKLLVGSVVPRPIAWVSTQSASGVANLAPFSFFTVASTKPPMLCFSVGVPEVRESPNKDTLACIQETGEFVVNISTVDLIEQLVASAAEVLPEVDEFEIAGLRRRAGTVVRAPYPAEAPVSMECSLRHLLRLGTDSLIVGEVVCFHVADNVLGPRGRIDLDRLAPIGRLSGPRFSTVFNVLTKEVPTPRSLLAPVGEDSAEDDGQGLR